MIAADDMFSPTYTVTQLLILTSSPNPLLKIDPKQMHYSLLFKYFCSNLQSPAVLGSYLAITGADVDQQVESVFHQTHRWLFDPRLLLSMLKCGLSRHWTPNFSQWLWHAFYGSCHQCVCKWVNESQIEKCFWLKWYMNAVHISLVFDTKKKVYFCDPFLKINSWVGIKGLGAKIHTQAEEAGNY